MKPVSITKLLLIPVIIAIGLAVSLFKYTDLGRFQHATISQNLPDTSPLPDLVPLPMYDIHLGWLNGHRVLRFTSAFWNSGRKQFELIANPNESVNTDGYQNVYQRVINNDGTEQKKLVGNFLWHAPHNHYHYGDFANYVFSLIKAQDPSSILVPSVMQKTTFCLRDNYPVDLSLPGASQVKLFAECGLTRQGVSIGWTDVYKYDLPDQYIDVQNVPPGIYSLSFFLDPNQRFNEERKDNNISTVFIELNVSKGIAKVVASAAPFQTSKNTFLENTLVKASNREEIYVIHDNKKRWIKNEEIFNSYGYRWDSIYPLTQAMIEAIPFNNLVRLQGTEEVFALNDLGYKRHILNPDVFFSYQFTPADIADINQTEMNIYPDSNLIMTPGIDDVYTISGNTKKKIGTYSSLQSDRYNLAPLHIINRIDFDAYTTLP